MPRNIVVCCDGTGNQVEENLSNMLKLFRIVVKGEEQRVFYDSGVGTIGLQNAWEKFKANWHLVLGLATGYGLDQNILRSYRFLCENYEAGDRIYLFGFSRGAYAMRALAGFVHLAGLLPRDQLNLADYALQAYKDAGEAGSLDAVWRFQRITGSATVPIHFMGLWDTVASILVPFRGPFLLPGLQTLPYTQKNPSVRAFRHAIALDERRRMFRSNRWKEGNFQLRPWLPSQPQDNRQVVFAGVHSDVGGGYREAESAISKFPLRWMVDQAEQQGLHIDPQMRDHLIDNQPFDHHKTEYARRDPSADIHDSMNWAWRILEWLPKRVKFREWASRAGFAGWYLPRAEPRYFREGMRIHSSLHERFTKLGMPRPINIPEGFEVEP